MARLLANRFYIGIIDINGETYEGAHQPLVSLALFEKARAVAEGKVNQKTLVHDFTFKKLLSCATCNYSLIGERQKGHVYYRCHTRKCPTTSIREESLDDALLNAFGKLRLSNDEQRYLNCKLGDMRLDDDQRRAQQRQGLKLAQVNVADRLNRLTDLYVDGGIDQDNYEERRSALLVERRRLADALDAAKDDERTFVDMVEEFLELGNRAYFQYKKADPENRRELVRSTTSNRTVSGKTIEISMLPA